MALEGGEEMDGVESVTQRQHGRTDESDSFDILILDGTYKQSLRAAQSLGRSGLKVAWARVSSIRHSLCPLSSPDTVPGARCSPVSATIPPASRMQSSNSCAISHPCRPTDR